MKKLITILGVFTLVMSTVSCDKITYPTKIVTELDTALFTDGQFAEYPWPVFAANTNTNRNVLIEDYTGHKCPNCPEAAEVAEALEIANPGRVFVTSIHTGAGGDGFFQSVDVSCTDQTQAFCYDFRTNEGNTYGEDFGSGFGFIGNPQGTFNRAKFGTSDMFYFKSNWGANVNTLLNENDLKVNLQAEGNYYAASNGIYLHIQSEFIEDLTGNYNIVTYVVQNQIIEDQDVDGVFETDYHHHNVFLGCIDGEAWGHAIGGTDPASGTKVQTDYSYVLPTGLTSTDIHFLTYIYDVNSFEILQVIKYEL